MSLKNLLHSIKAAQKLLMTETDRSRRELARTGLPLDTFAAVMQAREHLDRGLQSPRVRIAVTGTTSSGKSSLLNFLCGEKLLPTGVQEKSAGLVRIVHDEHVRLKIAATPGCRWECGVWDDISGEDIQTRLDAVMDAFLKERDAGNRPAPPSAVIHYPTWLGKQLGIQEQAGLELLDLPGLRSCRDDGLNDLIRECRDALCLVTFSAEDSDPERRRKSMTQVLDEVRALGGNTRRLLFVATRTDAFLARDAAHWPANEEAFLASCTGDILSQLRDAAGTGATEKPVVTRLCPQPALYAQLFRNESTRMAAWKKIRGSYLFLVESGAGRQADKGVDIENDLSNTRSGDWIDADWDILRRQLEDSTGSAAFLQRLSSHITEQMPLLVLHPLLTGVLQAMQRHREALQQQYDEQERRRKTTEATLAAWRQKEKDADGVLSGVDSLIRNTAKALRGLADATGSAAADEQLAAALHNLAATLPAPIPAALNTELNRFGELRAGLRRRCLRPMRSVCNALLEVRADDVAERLAGLRRGKEIAAVCKRLQELRYAGNRAQEGWRLDREVLWEITVPAADIRQGLAELVELLHEAAQEQAEEFLHNFHRLTLSLLNSLTALMMRHLADGLQRIPDLPPLLPQELPQILCNLEPQPAFPAPRPLPPLSSDTVTTWRTVLINGKEAKETVQLPVMSGVIPSCITLDGEHGEDVQAFMADCLGDISSRLRNYTAQFLTNATTALDAVRAELHACFKERQSELTAEAANIQKTMKLLQQAQAAGQKPLAQIETLRDKLAPA